MGARQCEGSGIFTRRHGALLLDASKAKPVIISEGFNHPAQPLNPRGFHWKYNRIRTFSSIEEAAEVGMPPKRRRLRPAQRHAEIHCLLQLPRLADASGKEVLVVELADVGPSLCWAEPCSRGCMQLLMKHDVARVRFTDG